MTVLFETHAVLVEDFAAVHANDGQGIGLFRSEFLYLQASDYPTEEQQFEAYRTVAADSASPMMAT